VQTRYRGRMPSDLDRFPLPAAVLFDLDGTLGDTVETRARVERVGDRSWSIVIDPDAAPAAEPNEVALASFSTGADFVFSR